MQCAPCVKCGSSEIHYGSPWGWHSQLYTTMGGASQITYLVCCNCGNVEMRLEGKGDRKCVANEWPKADVQVVQT